jgi:ATP-dependent DNA helicase RecG
MQNNSAEIPIQHAKGIGPGRARLFACLGIRTVGDAFYYIPHRYDDRSHLKPLNLLDPGSAETVSGTVISMDEKRRRNGNFHIFEIVLHDGSGYLKVKWFNQPYIRRNFKLGQTVVVSGMVKKNTFDMPPVEMDSPEYEIVTDDGDSMIHTKRIVPVYGLTAGISQKQFRKLMFSIIMDHAAGIQDPLPARTISKNGLAGLAESVLQLHFPTHADDMKELNSGSSRYHRRLIFDELFMFELGLAVMKSAEGRAKGISFRSQGRLRNTLLKLLPFRLTPAQQRVLEEIERDMKAPHPMNRLLQGDVGCGKTVIALLAMIEAVESGFQAALMAPTGILAEQHFMIIHNLIGRLGLKTLLLTSGTEKHAEICGADIIIGTHALIQEKVVFRRLGLVVIDEQHKFGVVQRALLRKKGSSAPDLLVMTATPIPRSLAHTIYGDLDCSVINELPLNRKPSLTRWIEASKKDEIYAILKRELGKGRQAYVVYPAIEESEKMDLKSAAQGKTAFERRFPEFRVGLLHGRMKAEERTTVMALFKKGEVDILVSTTVIEVGVDVPNATVMLIVHAERFGLSQLHQLRGRVGRGTDESHCILIAYHPLGEDARRRLKIMVQTSDGFRIAEEDLGIRGQGEFFGTRQSGLPELRHANVVRDAALLEAAKAEAFSLIAEDPELKESPFLKKQLDVFWKGRVDLFSTG